MLPRPTAVKRARPRKKVLVASLAALFLALGATLTLNRWALIGLWRGESFYQGQPTGWWDAEVNRYERRRSHIPLCPDLPAALDRG